MEAGRWHLSLQHCLLYPSHVWQEHLLTYDYSSKVLTSSPVSLRNTKHALSVCTERLITTPAVYTVLLLCSLFFSWTMLKAFIRFLCTYSQGITPRPSSSIPKQYTSGNLSSFSKSVTINATFKLLIAKLYEIQSNIFSLRYQILVSVPFHLEKRF